MLLIALMVASLNRQPSGPPGTIRGRVTNFSGVSITNVYVEVEGTQKTGSSGTTGEFVLAEVPSGHQKLVVKIKGVSGMSIPLIVTANQTVDVGTLQLYTP